MSNHITTMRYAMEIATLAQAVAERDGQIEQMRILIEMKDQQLDTVLKSAKDLADQNTALVARENRRAERMSADRAKERSKAA
ncbi:hypothetical protein [Chromobacterium subtsugae]|uniref:hypothetical protein n=1 Tax=Chromobacterium subtsugae TaxID=251747 RepID=UPI0007F8D100|nr:hypothetical protein [Chromobacterium subtsugae]OBU84560.1 hypothetical protein MY55_21240 [Chromobacterium subtsugae]